jgi:hypothetical protein
LYDARRLSTEEKFFVAVQRPTSVFQQPNLNPSPILYMLTFDPISIKFNMHQKALLILTLAITACAHKAPPLFKDRLSPRLVKTAVLNTRQLQLSFSEDLDTNSLFADSILIISTSDTLDVMLLYPSLSASEIILITGPMSKTFYDIRGAVFDVAENRGIFHSTFQGSVLPDTIAPWLVEYAKGRNTHEFFLRFSEAMDTSSLVISVVPKKNMLPVWVNHRYTLFAPVSSSDSLRTDTTYYLYLKKAYDLSGNSIPPFVTSITPDTVYKPIILKGKAMIEEELVKQGLALLKREALLGVATVQAGEFIFEVRDSMPFNIQVIAGEYSGTGRATAGAENIIHLQEERVDIDRLID